MTTDDSWERWADHAAAFGVQLTDQQVHQFQVFERLLLDWNRRMNLTAIREPAEIRQRHFLDALSCIAPIQSKTPDLAGRALIDIGTGAGFPGLPLKIVFPELNLTLVDSVKKKTVFLEAAVASLNLKAVQVVDERAETLGQDPQFRERFDWVVARSVARLNTLVELLLPLAKIGGFVLSQKGESAAEECRDAQNGIALLGGGAVESHRYQLPGRDFIHFNIVIAKTEKTPAKYPRRVGIPNKRPL
ncbi:MAG: 16S rRNA (guanine(527)-N(7))-methyltransferase RsmG [Ardenticatenaceae bacterium]|nr:16S rRNA (guanine(527)-N(7))-methyltransferase RsmG [Ardenticatenaceae bacterium]